LFCAWRIQLSTWLKIKIWCPVKCDNGFVDKIRKSFQVAVFVKTETIFL
jgi:hypothetical protein